MPCNKIVDLCRVSVLFIYMWAGPSPSALWRLDWPLPARVPALPGTCGTCGPGESKDPLSHCPLKRRRMWRLKPNLLDIHSLGLTVYTLSLIGSLSCGVSTVLFGLCLAPPSPRPPSIHGGLPPLRDIRSSAPCPALGRGESDGASPCFPGSSPICRQLPQRLTP